MLAFIQKHKLSVAAGAIGLTYGGLKYRDKLEVDRIQASVMPPAFSLAAQPMGVSELPRRLLVVVTPANYGRWEFNHVVKPVLDAAALDYAVVELKEKGDVERAVVELEKKGRVEGVVAVGTPAFNEMVTGLAKRLEEGKTVVPLGFVPQSNIGAWWMLPYSHFVYYKRWGLMGPPALAAALGHTRELRRADLDHAAAHADPRAKPEELPPISPPTELSSLAVFAMGHDGVGDGAAQ